MKKACSIILAALFLIFSKRGILAQVVINEFVIDGSPEWVELYNSSSSADYLKEYYIDDDESFTSDTGSSGKKSLVNLNISNLNFPFLELTSSIFNNSDPDYVVLFDKAGNLIDSYSYALNPGKEISIGRSPDNSGDFYVLSSTTKGDSNALPTPSPTPTPSSTPTATPTYTPTSTPSPTKTPTPTPTKTPIPSPTKSASPTPEESPTESPTQTPTPTQVATVLGESIKKKGNILPYLLIIAGVICLGIGGYFLYNRRSEEI